MSRSGFNFASAPFICLLVPLVVGVSLTPDTYFSAGVGASLLLFLSFIALLIFKDCSFRRQHLWGALLFLALLCYGIIRNSQRSVIFPKLQQERYFAILDEYPEEKEKTFQIVAQFVNSEHRILVYIPKSLDPTHAKPGDILCFEGQPEPIRNDGNPFEFDYSNYLSNKNIGYRIFLKEGQFFFLSESKQLNIFRLALIFRSKLVECLDRSSIRSDYVHLIASIAFGAREEVDKEVVQSFTNTGVIHVLAVSGMNVGLIYIILDFLFRFLKRGRVGFLMHSLIMLLGIWTYTLITGMSASILRAALMLTFVIIGGSLSRNSNIYNSLAVSAFVLIAWNPAIIEDVGFQLSYVAVLSIVVIQPYIYKQLYFKFWLWRQVWLLISVSLAAQIGTLPLILHYFHQFPVYFLLANLAVIPLVTLILYLSFVFVFLSQVSGFLASLVAFVLDWSVRLVILTVNFVEDLPHSVLRGLYPSSFQILLVFLAIISVYGYLKIRKVSLLRGAILFTIGLALSVGSVTFRQITREEIVFFNIPGTRAMVLTQGKEAIVLYDRWEKGLQKLNYYLNPYLGERGIDKVDLIQLSDSLRVSIGNIHVVGHFVNFNGVKLYIQPIHAEGRNGTYRSHGEEVVWLRSAKEYIFKKNKFPDAKFVLYRASDNQDEMHQSDSLRKYVDLKASVLLDVRQTLPGNLNRVCLDYFSELN